ncbi:hypothetical protein [Flavilitoribacter nigricans]|uniref:Tetratricopeptide repeat protein n=1 Tax=Flavilitoribacter nigricans (strain ATCC 23147 / DSM 23189 / NBRC 102662 / NCIMB 1420 / SS-2) TaxID=1122177 RepID=A0A2D0MYR1_FLAN2|nr:hypothetical protein [Flavilitoribacter nigricans]PHN01404.1 hypothetical protein CRP01_37090 [Flavilitoribacter nigricans DSM 23189 = NBRC 102662]
MNLENFAEYLKYPSRLYQLPYEELKSLTMQYPYCSNFHVLLLIKSKLENHPDLEKNLARAATYSVDRKHLRRIMLEEQLIPAESQITIGEDEILELKDLFTLDDEWEKIPVDTTELEENEAVDSLEFDFSARSETVEEEGDLDFSVPDMDQGENSDAELPESTPTESFSDVPEIPSAPEVTPIVPEDVKDSQIGIPDAAAVVPAFALPATLMADLGAIVGFTQTWSPPVRVVKTPKPVISYQLSEALIADCVAANVAVLEWWEERENVAVLEWEITPAPARTAAPAVSRPVMAPTPKSKFQSYKKRYRRPLEKEIPPPPPPPPVPVETGPGAKKVAEESVREDLGVASETLAGLLVQQHQYERAIKMYEHLSLLIPEKNTYFAAKIDAIKNL